MEDENDQKISVIWIYLLPIFLLAAWPALKWMKKAGSSDIELSKADYSLFNSQEGEIRRSTFTAAMVPELNDGILGVRYNIKPKQTEAEKAAEEARVRAAAARAAGETTEREKEQEQYSAGSTKGYLIFAVEKTMNDPRTVAAVFNNKFVISGFMDRSTVKTATCTRQRLADYLKNGAALGDFLNNPTVRAALKNPAIVDAVAASGLIKALMATPAITGFIKNPDAVNDILKTEPQLKTLASNPNIRNALMKDPATAAVMKKIAK